MSIKLTETDIFKYELVQFNKASKKRGNSEGEFTSLKSKALELNALFIKIQPNLSDAESSNFKTKLNKAVCKFAPPSHSEQTELYDASPKAAPQSSAPLSPVLKAEPIEEGTSPKSPDFSVSEMEYKDDDAETWV